MTGMGRLASRAAWLVALGMAAVGCASSAAPRFYVNPQADMALYQRVAVLPFHNLSQQPLAGERVTRVFVTELIITDRYRIVEPAEFRAVLRDMDVQPTADGAWDPAKLKQAAGRVDATGIVRGVVTEYQVQRSGQDEFAVLSFDAELIDVDTGNVVWRGSITRRGASRFPVFGGASSRTLGTLTQEACVELVDGLRKRAF
jgi:TolB-like protein